MLVTYALRTLSTFYPPQKPVVFSGEESALKLVDMLVSSGSSRPLIVTDTFLFEHGMLDPLLARLEQLGCAPAVYSGVVANPTMAIVEEGLAVSVQRRCDGVLAVGGGSVIDVAKVIAAASTSSRGIEKLVGVLKVREPLLPFYVVPTTSGTGSEATTTAVISDSETHKKKFFVDPKYIPVAAALDPTLLESLPPHITASTGMDALTHAIEAYTSRNRFSDTDHDARLAIKLIFEFLPRAYHDGHDRHAREMVAQASFFAGHAFTKASLGYVHAISHQVSAHYNTPHGLANAVILPHVLRFNQPACAQEFAELEELISGEVGERDVMAERFVARVEALGRALGIPDGLDELVEEDLDQIATEALREARMTYAVPKRMRHGDARAVLVAASA